jgi:hypothetical protein
LGCDGTRMSVMRCLRACQLVSSSGHCQLGEADWGCFPGQSWVEDGVAVALWSGGCWGQSGDLVPVGFQKSATCAEQRFHAARSYSLIRPPRTGRRLIRSSLRSATGWVGRGGRRSWARCGHRPLSCRTYSVSTSSPTVLTPCSPARASASAHTGAGAPGERDRRTLDRHRPPRAAGPDTDRQPPPPRTRADRVRGALHPAPPPRTASRSTTEATPTARVTARPAPPASRPTRWTDP